MIICITGLPGAGKSVVGRMLGDMGYKVYELGDVVREMMKEQGIELTPQSDRQFTINLRKKYGKFVVVKYLLDRIKLKRNSKVAIVGVRSKAELDYIRKRARIITFAVVAPTRRRFERIRIRGRPDAPKTLAAFVRDKDKKEASWGELGAIKNSDFVISNSRTEQELRKSVKQALSEVRKAKAF